MISTDYRWMAREAFERARKELASNDRDRLRYAALELRSAMEALSYDKAQSYKDEVPVDLYRTWQPPKLVDYITDVDEHAYHGSSLSYGVEDEPGKPAKLMKPLGTEIVLTMKNLKAHYNALGSFLHIPTVNQLERGKPHDEPMIRKHCERCIDLIEKVLSSRVWNANFGIFTYIECFRCKFLIKKRLPSKFVEPINAKCIKCHAEYTVSDDGGRPLWEPKVHQVNCPTDGCNEKIRLWKDELEPGTAWKCQGCGEDYILELSIGKCS